MVRVQVSFSFHNTVHTFALSLASQLLLCNWCAENWRWYINFLEETLREATSRAAIRMYKVPDPLPSTDFQATLSRRTFSGRTLTDNTPMQAPMFPPPPPFTSPQSSQPTRELPPLPSSLPKVGSEGEDFSLAIYSAFNTLKAKLMSCSSSSMPIPTFSPNYANTMNPSSRPGTCPPIPSHLAMPSSTSSKDALTA